MTASGRVLMALVEVIAAATTISAAAPRTISGFSADATAPTPVSGTIVLRGVPGGCPTEVVADSDEAPVPLPPATCDPDGYRLEWDTTVWLPCGEAPIRLRTTWPDAGPEAFYLTVRSDCPAGPRTLNRGIYVTNGWPDTATGAPPDPGSFAFAERPDTPGLYPWVGGLAVILHWRFLQEELTGPLRLTELESLLSYAQSRERRLLLIIKAGGDGSPPWLFAPPLSRVRLNYPGGPGLWQKGDRVADDLWTNVTAQLAARFGDHPGFAGIYQAGAGAHYPEMWFGLPESCQAPCSLTADELRDDYDRNGNTPADHGLAWAGMAARLSTQFPRGIVVNMLDQTYERPPAGPRRPTPTAMDAVLSSERFTSLPPGGQSVGTVNLTLTDHEQQDRSPKYETLYGHRPGIVPKIHEVDPARLTTSAYAAAAHQPSPTDLETVVGYCDGDPDTGERPGMPVSCDAVIVHRQNVHAGPAYGPRGTISFDPWTLARAAARIWRTAEPPPSTPQGPWTR